MRHLARICEEATKVTCVFALFGCMVMLIALLAFAEETTKKVATRCSGGAQLVHQQRGSAVDDLGDVEPGTPAYLDLMNIELYATEGEPDIEAQFSVAGVYPPSGFLDVRYRMLFDADNNPATGQQVAETRGVEREVRLHIFRTKDKSEPSVSGSVVDHVASVERPLPTPPELVHARLADVSHPQPIAEQFAMFLPREMLSLTAEQVSVTLIAEDNKGIADRTRFTFDQQDWAKQPTMIVGKASPGQPVQFSISGLTPGKSFALTIDTADTVLLRGTIGSDGDFSGTFIIPGLSPADYFVTAQDTTGAFAFDILQCK